MATSLQISFSEDQLVVLGNYYRNELKNAVQQVENLKDILAKIESRTPRKTRGRKPSIEKLAKAFIGKKRGPKPGSKRNKPYTGKKRGPKPKNQDAVSA